jgi:hypothetical protein
MSLRVFALIFAFAFSTLGCSDDAAAGDHGGPLPPPAAGEGFQLDEGSFVIEPGVEGTYCMRLPVPEPYRSGTGPLYVRGQRSYFPPGTHHFFMQLRPEPLDTAEPCAPETGPLLPLGGVGSAELAAILEIRAGAVALFGGKEGHSELFLPQGYARVLEPRTGHFTTDHHVLNLTASNLAMGGAFNLYVADETEVHHPVSWLTCTQYDVAIEPRSTRSVSATCTVPFDMDLVMLASHAHQHLTKFEMRLFDGSRTLDDVIYESTDWDSPKSVVPEPFISLGRGQGITYTCHYENSSDAPVKYDSYGENSEMCAALVNYAYPPDRPGERPPSLAALSFASGSTSAAFEAPTSEFQ